MDIEQAPQFLIVEPSEQVPSFSTEEQHDQGPPAYTEEQHEQVPSISTEEQPALEDQNQTNTTVISKPKRSRQSTQSHKNTEDIQASAEAIGNTTGTNPASDTLEK